MRSFPMIAAIPLLAHCGSPDARNDAAPSTEAAAVPGEPGAVPGDATTAAAGPDAAAVEKAESVSPCLVQGDQRLELKPLRAVGTEPFWGARIEGRCVTYSTPDDQQGTRVWTRYSPGPAGSGVWAGQLGGKSFELRTRTEPGCSDGMSDKRYPIAVELSVGGEQRKGCAEPL